MLDTIHTAVLESGRSLFYTLSKLTSEEIFSIWDTVFEFVEKQLSMNKGVLIPGLGTFSFLRQKLEIGSNKYSLIQRPVFLLSEKLVQIHGLKRSKIYTPGDIPIVKLNFIVLSLEGPFNRETVEGCVRETLLFFSRSIANKQNVEFTFKGIGVLVIRDNKVKMKFYKDFIQAMDGSGNLLKALSNRPGTVDSVLSGRETSFPLSRNTIMFPRMELKEMETIAEEGEKPSKEKEQTEKENSKKEHLSPKRLLCRQAISPAKVTGVSLTDEFEKNLVKTAPPRPIAPVSNPKTEQEASLAQIPAPRPRTPARLCQDHGRAGQEMCYLCMQRAQRSVPLYLNEEKRRKEKEEDRVLAQYLTLKDHDALRKQQLRALVNREQNQKIAAFNLGVAEALRSQKREKAAELYKSYIFEKRPLSATLQQKHDAVYSKELAKQLEEKTTKETKQKKDQDLVERLEQVQLAEELAAQRAKYLKDRMNETQCYKKALDLQIKMKPAPLPHCEPDSNEAIFGKNDLNKGKMEDRRKRSRDFSRHQLQAAADHKRAAILSQLIDQRRAEDMIQRARKQWLAEKGSRLEKIFQMNLAMRDDWEKSAELKRQRDYEEKLFQRAGDKLLLLDQCAKYRRCYQCKRGLSNCGEGDEWTDNKYIPGSRLIV
ncbi:coiled-coil domain-containing protein 81 [Eublepharis macularius]|uniref:Coiled-coil domain-containing protein 81 n=1 Tax=Eublepharis macularius TaxID=481883 RepID=A0AA97J1W6_EUBMA|nr:coiled-coil domain-containing protein 81 [Eublepharis macularius]